MRLNEAGIPSVYCRKAIYEGHISLKELIDIILNFNYK
jgi:hypothetical protein